MFKKLLNWIFCKEEDLVTEDVNVFDFTERGEGHDITLRMINDGEYATAVVCLSPLTEEKDLPKVGDFIVVNMEHFSQQGELEEHISFVIESVERIALGVSQLTLTRYNLYGENDE